MLRGSRSRQDLCLGVMRSVRQLPIGPGYAVSAIGRFGAAPSFALDQVWLYGSLVAAAEGILCFSHWAMTTTLGPVSSAATQSDGQRAAQCWLSRRCIQGDGSPSGSDLSVCFQCTRVKTALSCLRVNSMGCSASCKPTAPLLQCA